MHELQVSFARSPKRTWRSRAGVVQRDPPCNDLPTSTKRDCGETSLRHRCAEYRRSPTSLPLSCASLRRQGLRQRGGGGGSAGGTTKGSRGGWAGEKKKRGGAGRGGGGDQQTLTNGYFGNNSFLSACGNLSGRSWIEFPPLAAAAECGAANRPPHRLSALGRKMLYAEFYLGCNIGMEPLSPFNLPKSFSYKKKINPPKNNRTKNYPTEKKIIKSFIISTNLSVKIISMPAGLALSPIM